MKTYFHGKEKVLVCKCHKVDIKGNVYSRWVQFAQKGMKGIQSKIVGDWEKLRLTKNPKSGYLQMNLHGRMTRINRLVAMYFIPNLKNFPECHHANGIKTDNRVSNLKWGNQKQNAADRHRHGKTAFGNRQPAAKLNEELVRKIRKERSFKSLNVLARECDVSQRAILLAFQKKTWKHVK